MIDAPDVRLFVFAACGLALPFIADARAAGDASRFASTGNRSQYVHRIPLYDAKGTRIDPANPDAAPYSPLQTCSKCHAYDEIAHGWHFNALADLQTVSDGRPGEPWILNHPKSGTQLPLSYRDWAGAMKPEQVGLTPWLFTLEFGRHLPGGGPGVAPPASPSPPQEPAPEGEAEAEAPAAPTDGARWPVAGDLVIDCMACHAGDRGWSHDLWAEQIGEQNFAWASTAAYGLAKVDGRVSALPDSFDPAAEGAPAKLPKTAYLLNRFNSEGEVFFDIIRKPTNNQCYQCHTVRPVGEGAAPRWDHDEDIHVRAGIACADCHRNGIEHHTVRGYVGEQHPTGRDVSSLSCVGCHLGDDAAGRLGAPKPLHEGIPPVHFERMSCTSCHSGPMPTDAPQLVQTSMAHALGLSEHRSFTEPPEIAQPIFLKPDGVVTPHRMMWPAFWGVQHGGDAGEITPIQPEEIYKDLRRALRIRKDFREEVAADGPEEFEKKLTDALKKMGGNHAKAEDERLVFVANGRVFALNEAGDAVVKFDHQAAEPYAWPLAHNVRPAQQSLGVKGCTECHAPGVPIYYAKVTALGPAADGDPIVTPMHEMQGVDATLVAAWEQSFQGRPAFKIFGWVVAGFVGVLIVGYLGAGLHAAARCLAGWGRKSKQTDPPAPGATSI